MIKEEDFIYEDRLIYLDTLIYFIKKYRNAVEHLYNHDVTLEDLIIYNDNMYEELYNYLYNCRELLDVIRGL